MGNVITVTELHFNYQRRKPTPNPTTDNTAKAKHLGPDPAKTYVHIYAKLYTVTGQLFVLFLQL